MVGEIEEPSGLDFKVNSGSISFGRFESESLCWERRSSFSHNRYLEEVEKYSKPGSVTEKKAYFEAHFKKKGILSMLSPGAIQNQTYRENEEDNQTNEDQLSPSTDESWMDDTYLMNEKVKNLSEAEEVFEPKIELSRNDSGRSGCISSDGGDLFLENSLLQGSEVKENVDSETCQLPDNELNGERRRSNDCPEDQHQEKSHKEKVAMGDESHRKPRYGVRVNHHSKSRGNISGEVSKTSEKKPSNTLNVVRSKKSAVDAKPVKPRTISSKVHSIKRVENEPRNTVVKPHSSEQRTTSGKVNQSVKRVVPVLNLSRPKQDSKIPSSKIENADLRKKEKAEAEHKQSRKGLDFKARPLPSFYRRASHESDVSKDATGNTKLRIHRRTKSKSLNNGNTLSENSRLNNRQGKAQNRVN